MTKYVLAFWLFSGFVMASGPNEEPEFQSGDLIFQTSKSKQSYAIMWASASIYSHVGIIEFDGKKKYVVEAINKVTRTPFKKWVERGRMARYAVYRYEPLDDEKRKQIVSQAKSYLGRNYDLYFSSLNQEIYCSELVDLAFAKLNIRLGTKQKVKELNVNNPVVKKLVKGRWKKHPACRGLTEFDECWSKILNDELVTPESIAQDSHLKKVFSNYPL